MAQSSDSTMKRLGKVEKRVHDVERAIVQVTHVLIDQSERMDAGFRALRDEMHAVTDRLDRLIDVTIKERTLGVERLLELERRVSRLEQHAGF